MTDWRYWITYEGVVHNCNTQAEARIEAADNVHLLYAPVEIQVEPLDVEVEAIDNAGN